MVKKCIKIIAIILVAFLSINIGAINNKSYAAGLDQVIIYDGGSGSGGYEPDSEETDNGSQESIDVTENVDYWANLTQSDTGMAFNKIITGILILVRTVGMIVSVIALLIIGIKYMIGSVEEKAQYKQTLFPWFIGAIMVFAITTIPSFLYEIATNTFK